ncbi:MAG: outer membrane beta-barrel protein [Bacteroidales bacterium]|jgi:hypothetical protein|nr:outer membrane beta-barrel protein [Bacteroidales bacterium]
MKKIIVSVVMLLVINLLPAQIDTVLQVEQYKIKLSEKAGKLEVSVSESQLDSAENLLFEGQYGENYSAETSFNYPFSKFTQKKNEKNCKRTYGFAHNEGFSIGFANLASKNLDNIGNADGAVLRLSSFDLDITPIGFSISLSKKHCWFFSGSLGVRYAQYQSDLNTAFRKVNHNTVQVEAPEGMNYKRSRIATWAITIPLMFEWQTKAGHYNFYISGGAIAAVNFYAASKVKYKDDCGKKQTEKCGYGMNTNPLLVDAKIAIGYGDVGIYARYGLISLFRKDRGPDVIPVALGIVWNW